MCIGVPGQIISIIRFEGIVETKGIQRKVNLALVPEAKVGDYVMVHAGTAIQIINNEEAQATLKLLEELVGDEE
ncbi:hydrogenase assembly protein HypC [Anoxybacter fermentans]|uniref:Hydrogenase assembly protein HypC n=1 Tax=Anoxybacter fermentans TaxID=1323375 RepID=A0A3Q9HPR6_9FIRM|nr:HypC/HybG/HupF family hydrogenase formation chaperone [Anoxybacter fermentans]AZR72941.1 hydrogenase assembly protein HypC [Anoxybacter fermentans]